MDRHSLFKLAVLGIALCTACVQTCSAQQQQQPRGQSRQGGRSGLGQSGFGQGISSGFGASPMGQGGRGQGGMGGAGFGQDAFGGFAGAGGGMGGAGGQQGFGNNQAGLGQQNGFLGGNAAQTQNFFQNLNGGQRRTAMFDFMIENLNEMRDRGGRGEGNDRTPPVRVKLRPAFETPLGTMRQLNADLETRLTSSLADLGVDNPVITMERRIVTLSGTVASDHQKQLVEKMISLEPGVSAVDNRLMVEAETAEE